MKSPSKKEFRELVKNYYLFKKTIRLEILKMEERIDKLQKAIVDIVKEMSKS